jgi:hypothetical protein
MNGSSVVGFFVDEIEDGTTNASVTAVAVDDTRKEAITDDENFMMRNVNCNAREWGNYFYSNISFNKK